MIGDGPYRETEYRFRKPYRLRRWWHPIGRWCYAHGLTAVMIAFVVAWLTVVVIDVASMVTP